MNIVVPTESRHRGTQNIGDRLAKLLNWAGHNAVHAQEGDFRDWDGADAFAEENDRYLSKQAAPALR